VRTYARGVGHSYGSPLALLPLPAVLKPDLDLPAVDPELHRNLLANGAGREAVCLEDCLEQRLTRL
jgi:hypothetical protein